MTQVCNQVPPGAVWAIEARLLLVEGEGLVGALEAEVIEQSLPQQDIYLLLVPEKRESEARGQLL